MILPSQYFLTVANRVAESQGVEVFWVESESDS